MYLGKTDVNTYDKGAEREFLVSNGTGSYGSSTVVGANTRGAHGMLVVRPHGSEQHTILVSKIEETLYANNKKYQLSTNRYKELIYPDGYRYVQEYHGTPFPSFMFVIHSIFLKKTIFMPLDGSGTVIKYELVAAPEEIVMDVRPLFAHRTATDLINGDKKPEFSSNASDGGAITVHGRGMSSSILFVPGAGASSKWTSKQLWFEKIIYERDGSTEEPKFDSLWSPGYSTLRMKEGDVVYVLLSETPTVRTADDLHAQESEVRRRMNALVEGGAYGEHSIVRDMLRSAHMLIAENKDAQPVILSGFPSVEQRARDTFISLPGLTLATHREVTARGVLARWLDKADACGAIMPSVIDSKGDAKTGDIDAGLWFLYALGKYCDAVSFDLAKERYASIRALYKKYVDGDEALGAAMDGETKLLRYINVDNTKHWMSGDVSGEPLVLRRGFLVEIEALWYNALCVMRGIADACGDAETASECASIADAVKASFDRTFWNESEKYLFDWVEPDSGKHDEAIRPNAILALSLPHPVMTGDRAQSVFATCWNELYTTYGLRTLDPHHDKFKGRAEGRQDQKKKARLRGMAWPWLIGQFVTAFMRLHPDKKDTALSFMRPFLSHMRRGCLGGVAEYFDGMMPYRPNGDVLSAVSQGELLRALHEDLA